ncbi:protoporphyrinogen oxidase [Haloactinopolyspora alba]|uniref:protoporphyrinogen oxidase n=1 Tax=Haloactinopolyspora alba TaxID=648780 RepID=UPI00197A7932|nr:protoporphyrinogen oxidase [Haloactinopolyspora alba]
MTAEDAAPRVAVVGGGISGLAAAWFLRRALGETAQIVVYEKRRDVGGHLRVAEVAGHPVDQGAEALLARRPEALELAEAVGLAADLEHPAQLGAGLWIGAGVRAMPTGTVMGVPDDPVRLAGVLDAAEVEQAAVADRGAGMPIDGDVAVGRLVRSRFGAAVADRMVEPMLGGVYSGHADELSLDATVPALGEAARSASSLGAAVAAVRSGGAREQQAGPVFAGVRGGVGRLPSAVAAASGATVRTDVTVRELHRTPSGWRLVTGPVPSPATDDVDAVVVATPPAPASRLLAGAVPAAASELGGIEAASMAIVTLAVPRSAFAAPPSSSGFLVPPAQGRTVKAVTYSSVKWPWLGRSSGDLVLLRASIGRHREVGELQRDDAELVDAVRADLREAAGLTGDPVDTRVTRWGGALPQYAVGHVDQVARIRASVAAVPGLSVCGAAYDGVGVPACIAASRAAADRVADELAGARARIGS